jgi:general stress protein 26
MLTTASMWLAGLLIMAAGGSSGRLPPEVRAALRTQKEIYVSTRRANGSRSQAAPVWFWWDGQALYFTTAPDSHKGRRIRKGSPVFLSVQGKSGPFFEGAPEIVTDREEVERLGREYADKYWIAWLGFFRPRSARVAAGKTLVVKVTPVAAL